jgi:glutamyl-tRNA synthetase
MKSKPETALPALKAAKAALEDVADWTEENVHEALMALPAQLEMKNGQVLWPVRIALTGKQFTPGGAIEIAFILGKEESLRRLEDGIRRLEK